MLQLHEMEAAVCGDKADLVSKWPLQARPPTSSIRDPTKPNAKHDHSTRPSVICQLDRNEPIMTDTLTSSTSFRSSQRQGKER